ncbi:hypothetical protein [Streptomyces sp. OS603R]|uniref:hypothetical protein n=1 Tax=Streptomyces sp. OS603R TaxID=3035287 RepID=UPI0024347E6A|nr:hypothetical protein [Streptomyces sp. OS603R]
MSFAGRPFTTFPVAVVGCGAGLTLVGPASAGVVPPQTAPAAAPRPDAGSSAKSRVIRVDARLYVGEELDLGAAGRTVGDQFVFSGDLASAEAGEERVVGSIGGFCVITDLERNAGQCASTAVLPEGQITVQGRQAGIPVPGPVVNAITAGTGAFRRSHGQVTQRVLTPATWQLTFELLDVPPHRPEDGRGPHEAPTPVRPSLPGT